MPPTIPNASPYGLATHAPANGPHADHDLTPGEWSNTPQCGTNRKSHINLQIRHSVTKRPAMEIFMTPAHMATKGCAPPQYINLHNHGKRPKKGSVAATNNRILY
jgi:hypothetical protein